MGLSDNIDALLTTYRITQEELASIAGITPGAVSGWRRGSRPRQEAVRKICAHFGLDEDSLLSEVNGLAARHAAASSAGTSQRGVPAIPTATTPLAIRPAATGRVPRHDEGHRDDEARTIDVPGYVIQEHPSAYAMRVSDDSMSKVVPAGACILVDPDEIDPRSGSIVAVEVLDFEELRRFMGAGSPVVLRTWYRGAKKGMLSPDCYSENMDDIIIDLDELGRTVRILGTVVWYQPISMMA